MDSQGQQEPVSEDIYSSAWKGSKAKDKHLRLKQHTLQESSPGFKEEGVGVVRERGRRKGTTMVCLCVGDGRTCVDVGGSPRG